jgi:hypothetical protein
MASLSNPAITTAGGAPIGFITTGAGGISDFGQAVSSGIFTSATYPPSGYAPAGSAALSTLVSTQYKAQPAAGAILGSAGAAKAASTSYNPDVNYTSWWSEYNGFTLTTANATAMRVDFYLVNCSAVITTGACSGGVIGPLNTQYYPAKALTSTAPKYVSATLSVAGYTVATFLAPQAAAFKAAVAADAGVTAAAVTITSVAASAAAGRHLLQSSVAVTFSVATTVSGAAAVATAIGNGMTGAQLVAAGLSAATGATVTTAPVTAASATAPVAASVGGAAASSAARAVASAAALLGALAAAL